MMARIAAATLAVAAALTACGAAADGGWTVTVYYTAVESFHHEQAQTVQGCLQLDCDNGHNSLGQYPAGFVAAVHDEGTGLITDGPHAGRYLNWSSDSGYWLDTAARDSNGRPLEPFVSAADDGVADGTPVRITGCGTLDDGTAVPAAVCARLSQANWRIRDEFTPGLGGTGHLDVYIGQETGPAFTSRPDYVTLRRATVVVG